MPHDRFMMVYKILRAAEWRALNKAGSIQGSPADLEDGFVHLSSREQVAGTVAKHFAGETDLVLLALDSDALDYLRWEPSRGGALFPHLYRELRRSDVVWAGPLPLDEHGNLLPEDLA